MEDNRSFPATPPGQPNREQGNPPSSRLTDEKISDDSGTEAKSTSPLAPAGLKNPFWKQSA